MKKWIDFSSRFLAPSDFLGYRTILGYVEEQLANEEEKKRKLLIVNGIAALTGVITGLAVVCFHWLIEYFEGHLVHSKHEPAVWAENMFGGDFTWGVFLILIPPLVFLLVSTITRRLAPEAGGHGVTEVIEAVMKKGGRIPGKVIFMKMLTSGLTIAGGGSVGAEGPVVQIGGASGSYFGQVLKLRAKLLRILVGCGAAGAMAASFNTPLAGVVFAIEIILLEFRSRSFIPLVIATVFATLTAQLYFGGNRLFEAPQYFLSAPKELVFYLGLSVIGGIVGAIAIKTIHGFEDFSRRLKVHYSLRAIVFGLALGVLGYHFPAVLGVGSSVVSNALREYLPLTTMAALVGLKLLATSLTFAAGGSGGVFFPMLFVGAMLGGSYGMVMQHWFPEIVISNGAYAMVGMAAVLAASTRAAFTAIVMIVELTMDFSVVLPLMFVVVLSEQISVFLVKHSLWSLPLLRKGVSFSQDIEVNAMKVTRVREVMTSKVDVIFSDLSLGEVRDQVRLNHSLYPVVTRDMVVVGSLRTSRLGEWIQSHGAEASVQVIQGMTEFSLAFPEDSVFDVAKKMSTHRDPRVLIVDRKTQRLLGIVVPTDFLRISAMDV